jgi:hypothetical protein
VLLVVVLVVVVVVLVWVRVPAMEPIEEVVRFRDVPGTAVVLVWLLVVVAVMGMLMRMQLWHPEATAARR